MHQPDSNRPEPFNCPECKAADWVPPLVSDHTCRYCGHAWQVRNPRAVRIAIVTTASRR